VLEGGKLKSGSGWLVPTSMHAPIRQDAALLEKGRGRAAASAFLTYLKGAKAQAIIRSSGYDIQG
jgi:molybdate transport system substrate-binding protein